MKIMAVDYGDARTGLAVCDRTEFLASPVGTIEEKSFAKVAEKIVYATREFDVGMVVIGLPKNMDGTEGARAEKSRKLADTLRAILPFRWNCGTSAKPPLPRPTSFPKTAHTAKSEKKCWIPWRPRSF